MEELSIKGKATRYDEAIEELRGLLEGVHEEKCDIMEEDIIRIFPELKESEEEKTKRMLDVITYKMSQHQPDIFTGEENEWLNDWIEKQGETFTKKDVDDAYLKGICDAKHELEKQDEKGTNGNEREIPNSEQRSVDKVEPKFKVGDWVKAISSGNIFKILSVNDGLYCVLCYDGVEANYPIEVEKDLAYWTIQDAKDGDVLTYKNDEVEWIFIYREIVPSASEVPHDLLRCYTLLEGNYYNWYGVSAMVTDDYKLYLKPSTKEQRDLLFQKMKEAGYEWDAEKKELRKVEQTSAWSEDDERMFNSALWHVKNSCGNGSKNSGEFEVYNWLKSLKDRVGCETNCATTNEWSAEDKRNLLDVKCIIDEIWHNQNVREEIDHSSEELELLWHWLDNIRKRVGYPQSRWKPSGEQMQFLLKYAEQNNYDGAILTSLYQGLKKLRGK